MLKTEKKAQEMTLKIMKKEHLATAEEIEMSKKLFQLYNIEYINNMIIALLELVYRVLQIIAYFESLSLIHIFKAKSCCYRKEAIVNLHAENAIIFFRNLSHDLKTIAMFANITLRRSILSICNSQASLITAILTFHKQKVLF